jgi:hypothetical protein
MVDRPGKVGEELPDAVEVGGVEGRAAHRADLAGGALQLLGVAADEDHVGAPGARLPRGRKADAGAPTEHHGLSVQVKACAPFARGDRVKRKGRRRACTSAMYRLAAAEASSGMEPA